MTSSRHNSRPTQTVITRTEATSLPSVTEQDQHSPALGQAAFWRPRHAESSVVLGQVPFLFWLTEVTSPRLIVQMGLDDGIGYLALCQAAERLNGGTICLALENKEPAFAAALQGEHDGHYSDFSQIIGEEKAIDAVPEGIDLLVIGATLERDTVDLLRDDILPRLSDSAVVVVVNPDDVLADQTARRVLMGDDQPRMTLGPVVTGGAALEVILYGAKQPDRLRRLVVQQPGHSSWLAMRQAFNRLGQGIVASRQNRDLLRDKDGWLTRLKRAEDATKTLGIQVEKAEASEKVQHQQQAQMAARVHDLQTERDALAKQIAELASAREQAETARNTLQAERDALAKQVASVKELAEREKKIAERDSAAQLAAMRREVNEARAEHDTRIEDIVALTASYENARKQIEEKTKAQLAEANKRVADLQRQLAEVSAHRDALLGSTSWKITSPLRKVTSTVRGY